MENNCENIVIAELPYSIELLLTMVVNEVCSMITADLVLSTVQYREGTVSSSIRSAATIVSSHFQQQLNFVVWTRLSYWFETVECR